jgi:hypothetical protein
MSTSQLFDLYVRNGDGNMYTPFVDVRRFDEETARGDVGGQLQLTLGCDV